MPRKGPTADFDQITLRWAGVNLDGAPITGRLELVYNLPAPLLDDDPTFPVAIYPTAQTRTLTTAVIQVEGDSGALEDRTVGYASWRVPATDDPDIQGSGGTYTLTERLDNARGVVRTFVASKDVPGGVIWLNRITSVAPVPGEAVSAVSVAEFEALKAQVALGGGGTVTTEAVQDIVGAMVKAGVNTSVAYDDPAGTVTISLSGAAGSALDTEGVQDVIGAMIAAAGGTYNDAANTITLPTGSGTTTRLTLALAPTGYTHRVAYATAAAQPTLAAFLTSIGATGRTDFSIIVYGQLDTDPDILWLRDPQDESTIGPAAA